VAIDDLALTAIEPNLPLPASPTDAMHIVLGLVSPLPASDGVQVSCLKNGEFFGSEIV
jgi:hypothetical protein